MLSCVEKCDGVTHRKGRHTTALPTCLRSPSARNTLLTATLPLHAPPCLRPPPAARAQRQSQAVQRERAAILDDMARLGVESGAVARAAKAAAKEREEALVEVDVWKLEVRRLRTLLSR